MLRSPLIFLFILLSISSTFVLTESKPAKKHTKHNLNSFANSPKKQGHPNPTDAFCQVFTKQCYHEALDGKHGKVKLELACARHGSRHSSKYSFACKADGKDLTQNVLDSIGEGYTVTMTGTSTTVVTGTMTDILTSHSTTTQEVDSTSTVDASSTETDTITNTATSTEIDSTTLTTVIPITSTVTSIATVTTTTPVTSTLTSTYMSFIPQAEPVPVLQVSMTPAQRRKRLNKVDKTEFCSAYTAGCKTSCSNVHSTPNHEICHSTGIFQYSLTCVCKNNKDETEHALKAAVDQEHIVSVSKIATSTTYATVTSTTVIPTTVLSTSLATVTATVPVTDTYTSMTTVTQTSTSTGFTGLPVTLNTSTLTQTSTATATSTIYSYTTTTQTVVAPTGAIQAFKQSDGTSEGYLQDYGSPNDIFRFTTDITQANTFAQVVDAATGLSAFYYTDGTGRVIYSEDENSSTDYEFITSGQPSDCGAAGSSGADAAGSGKYYGSPCAAYIFFSYADSQTSVDGTQPLINYLYQTGSRYAVEYSWMLYNNWDTYPILEGTSNATAFEAAYDTTSYPINLRFPYTNN